MLEVGIWDWGRGGREGRAVERCGQRETDCLGFERLGSHCSQRVPGASSGGSKGDVQIGCRKPQTRLLRAGGPNRGKRLGRMSKESKRPVSWKNCINCAVSRLVTVVGELCFVCSGGVAAAESGGMDVGDGWTWNWCRPRCNLKLAFSARVGCRPAWGHHPTYTDARWGSSQGLG